MRIEDDVLRIGNESPDKIALRMDGASLTYGEVCEQVQSVAHRLHLEGFVPGQRVALCMANRIDYLVLVLGIVHAGLIVSPINPRLIAQEQEALFEELSPVLMISDGNDGLLRYTVHTEHLHVRDTDSDIFYIGYSSGTTGLPKGIMRRHASWVDSFHAMSREFHMDEQAIILLPGPLCYSASLIAGLHVLSIGGTVHVHKTFDAELVRDELLFGESNTLFMVPTMYRDLINACGQIHGTAREITLITAGDKMSTGTKEQLLQRFSGAQLYEYYGTSEVGFISVLRPMDQGWKPDSVGTAFDDAKVVCRDGEVFVNSTMGFCRYAGVGSPSITHVIDGQDGWLSTGDLGWIDEDKFLYLSGRRHEKMVRAGINVYPREIERALERHPDIVEVAAFAVHDERSGEVPVVAYVTNSGNDLDLVPFLREHLSAYKRPVFWWRKDVLPRNAAGKVRKMDLREEYMLL